jgi:hypothetical protein
MRTRIRTTRCPAVCSLWVEDAMKRSAPARQLYRAAELDLLHHYLCLEDAIELEQPFFHSSVMRRHMNSRRGSWDETVSQNLQYR